MMRLSAATTVACILLSTIAKVSTAETAPPKLIKVAVIDTGLPKDKTGLCESGHTNFSSEDIYDINLHSTNVSGLIHENAGGALYCQIMIKFYAENADGDMNTNAMINSIKYAIDKKVDIINISGGGAVPNNKEKALITKALDMGIKIVVAAGNESTNLDKKCDYFPACYDPRITVIANVRFDSKTNYGSIVDEYIDGNHKCSKDVCLSGSSQATAIFTGRLIKSMTR